MTAHESTPEQPAHRRLLICYDGSRHAEAAIATAADLFPMARADVLCVAAYGWMLGAVPGISSTLGLPANGMAGGMSEELLSATHQSAKDLAAAGARTACRLGLDATAVTDLTTSSAWHAIVRHAEQGDYSVVVLGSRGHSAIRTALLGGCTAGVTAHTALPTLVVHAPESTKALHSIDDEVTDS